MFKQSVPEIKSLEDIERNGKFLGEGMYGQVYKIGKFVYKIYHSFYINAELGNPAERSARYWNEIYPVIYDGKYKHLPLAEHKILKRRDGTDSRPVLITPFIDGKIIVNDPAFRTFNLFFRSLPRPLEMWDYNQPGNIRRTTSSNTLLPVDLDNVFPLPDDRGCFTQTYNAPQSPTTKYLAKEIYGRVRYKELKVEKPVIQEEVKKSSDKPEDVIGVRSFFMRP